MKIKKVLKPEYVIAIIAVSVLVVSMIPILAGAFYAHPLSDDFKYSRFVHDGIEEGGLSRVLPCAIDNVVDKYLNWQGTYAAIFVFSLMPDAIIPGTYFLTTFIIAGGLIASTYFFFHTIIRRVLGTRAVYAVILASLTLLLQFQFMPNKHEGLYWYNGATYYSLFYAFSLVFIALLLRFDSIEKRGSRIAVGILMILLAVIIGGGNYTTGLITVILTVAYTVGCMIRKKRYAKFYCAAAIVLLAAFAVSALAPGNQVRAANSQGMNPVIAVLKSLYSAAGLMGMWTKVPQIALFVFSAPIIYHIAGKSKLSFRYPLLVLVVSFGIFAAQMTPSLYALSTIGNGRQQDIYYYAYYLYVYSQMFYLFGWFQRKTGFSDQFGIKELILRYYLILFALYAAVSFVGCISNPIREMTSVDVALSLYSGEAREYDRQYKEIIEQLEEESEICYLPEIKTVPDFYAPLGIEEDDTFWINQRMAGYFGHEKIIKKE